MGQAAGEGVPPKLRKKREKSKKRSAKKEKPADDLFGADESADDLFGENESDDLFEEKPAKTKETPKKKMGTEDLFGASSDDEDLFSDKPKAQTATKSSKVDVDSLFGSIDDGDDDLFGGGMPSAVAGRGGDSLFDDDDAGDLFAASKKPATPAPKAESDDDLFASAPASSAKVSYASHQ